MTPEPAAASPCPHPLYRSIDEYVDFWKIFQRKVKKFWDEWDKVDSVDRVDAEY
jgi:hypothetical protein